MNDLRPWPKADEYGYAFDELSAKDAALRFQCARADAAMSRLRVAVEALTKINAIYPRCWDLSNGNLAILDKGSIDAFEEAHEAVSEALAAIGELPVS